VSTNKILAKVQCCIAKTATKSEDFDCLGLLVKAFTEAVTNKLIKTIEIFAHTG
jgi:hypothetical protein